MKLPGHYTLANRVDAYNFYPKMPVALDDNFQPLSKWRARWQRVKNFVLRPFRRKYVVTNVDVAAGVITVGDVDEKPAFWRFL